RASCPQPALKPQSAWRPYASELLAKWAQRCLGRIMIDQLRNHRVNLVQVPEIATIFVREEICQKSGSKHWSAIEQFRFLQTIVELVSPHVRWRPSQE